MEAGGAKGRPDPVRDAPTLLRLRVEGEAIERLDKQLSEFKDWKGHSTNPDSLLALCTLGKRAQRAIGNGIGGMRCKCAVDQSITAHLIVHRERFMEVLIGVLCPDTRKIEHD